MQLAIAICGKYFTEKNVGVLQINSELNDLSKFMYNALVDLFKPYGITLITFSINSITVDEKDSSYQTVKAALASGAKTRWESTAKTDALAYEQQKLGYTYQQKRSFDVMDKVAEKSNGSGNSNQFMEMGLGLAMGSQLGTMVGAQMGNVAAAVQVGPNKTKICPKCKGELDKNERFCHHCGADTSANEEVAKSSVKKCIKCNAEIDENMKFCPECGAIQQPKCPKCGVDVGINQKFCHECGAKIKENQL